MTLDATIRAVQAKLGVTVDGNPGPQTWNSIYRSLVGEPPASTAPPTTSRSRSPGKTAPSSFSTAIEATERTTPEKNRCQENAWHSGADHYSRERCLSA